MKKFWRDLSVAKKLYIVVGVMATLVAMELLTLLFAMNTLSTLRAFVGGEGDWSKAQKNAIHSLHLYIYTKEEQYYEDFFNNLKVNFGDRKARRELMKPEPDMQVAFEGFREGGVAPSDIPGVISLIRHFHEVSYLNHAIDAWGQADTKIDVLIKNAHKIHDLIRSGQENSAEMKQLMADTHTLNHELTLLENDFSKTLGDGSRWLERLLMITLFFAVLTVESTGLMLTVLFNRNLSRSLSEINKAALDIGEGKLQSQLPVRSNDELGQIAMTLNKMTRDLESNVLQRVRAENASQIKTLFLANVSHEIRTPLGVIIGLSEMIKDPNMSWEDRLKYTGIIENTGRNLTRIINDILDITKVESGHLQIQKSDVCLEEVLNDLSALMTLKAESHGNKFEIVREPSALAKKTYTDRSRLQQILINLANNAIKFTQNGTVRVRYGVRGPHIYFDVEDTGIGIPEESKRLLFQYFSQIDPSSTRKYEGTGLGLILSKKIAQSLGGDVELIRSELGKGSVFRLTIAHESGPEEVPATKPAQPAAPVVEDQLAGRKILVVDDSVDNQLLIQLYLKKKGMETEFADNGEAAVQKALSGNYDVVLMDMQMPIMDGYTATKTLREAGFKKPIIALTAHAMSDDRNRCLEAGCNEYLTKPIESGSLYLTLLNHVV